MAAEARTSHRAGSRSRAEEARRSVRDVERPLATEDLFFSTTDAKGIITSGNRVFERVSGYSLQEMVGRAHNIVRHPDMPRSVFQLLWDTLDAGSPIAAYVKNRTADGAFYWVLASVVPVQGGYLSVRLAPGSEQFSAARGLYAELRALEQEIEGDDLRLRKDAIAASGDLLLQRLHEAGFGDYPAFMNAALPAEVARRAGRLPVGHDRALASRCGDAHPVIAEMLGNYEAFSAFLAGLIADLTSYSAVGRLLAEHSAYLHRMGDDVRLFALNAQIGASRLGDEGAALDAVARLLTEQSQATSPLVATVAQHAAAAVSEIETMTFQLALSTLQAEMVAVFAAEICEHEDVHNVAGTNLLRLSEALLTGSNRTFTALETAAAKLDQVLAHAQQISAGIGRLARLSLNGRIELATVPDAGTIGSLFSDVERQVIDARARLRQFDSIRQTAADLRAAAGDEAMHIAQALHAGAGRLAEDSAATVE